MFKSTSTSLSLKALFASVAVLFLYSGCSEQSFSGGADSKLVKDSNKNKNPTVTIDPNKFGNDPDGLSAENGGTIADCGKGTMIEDPTAQYQFGNKEERTFLNSLGKYTNIPTDWTNQGNIHADQDSANTICKLKGYNAAVSFSSGSWYSCANNHHAYWDESIKNFVLKNGCLSNLSLQSTLCRGKLYDLCDKDKTWIFKK
jgi:hypothetical protein